MADVFSALKRNPPNPRAVKKALDKMRKRSGVPGVPPDAVRVMSLSAQARKALHEAGGCLRCEMGLTAFSVACWSDSPPSDPRSAWTEADLLNWFLKKFGKDGQKLLSQHSATTVATMAVAFYEQSSQAGDRES